MGTFRDFNAPVFKNLTSAIRALAMDAVQKANSGHPGMPMGMAEIAEVLWIHHLRHNPQIQSGLTATVSYCRTGMARC